MDYEIHKNGNIDIRRKFEPLYTPLIIFTMALRSMVVVFTTMDLYNLEFMSCNMFA